MHKKVHYVLPKRDFFSKGDMGRVTHALGVIEGFSENDWIVNVHTGPGLDRFKSRLSKSFNYFAIKHQTFSSFFWLMKLAKSIKNNAQDGDLLIIRYAIKQQIFLWILTHMFRKKLKLVVEINSLAFHHAQGLPKIFQNLIMKIEVFTCSRFDFIYVVSENLKNDFQKYNCQRPILVVPNGASSKMKNNYQPKTNYSNEIRLIYLGSLREYYDFTTIIKAFKILNQKHTKLTLLIYGSGEEAQNINLLAADNPSIKLMGAYKNEDIFTIISTNTDILLLPYKNTELAGIGSPTKLFEYMALRLPIVASRIGQIPNFVKEGINGVLYTPEDVNSLTESIAKLIENEKLRSEIGENAYNDFTNKHTWKSRIKILAYGVA